MPWFGDVFTRTNGVFSGVRVWGDDRDNDVPISAERHDFHDNDLRGGIQLSLRHDGGNSVTGDIDFGGNRITNLEIDEDDPQGAVSRDFLETIIDTMTPVGTIFAMATRRVPETCVLLDGAEYNIADEPELYDALSAEGGLPPALQGSTPETFRVPDGRGRAFMMQDLGTNRLTPDQSGVDGNDFGGGYGAQSVTLSSVNVAPHRHNYQIGSGETSGGNQTVPARAENARSFNAVVGRTDAVGPGLSENNDPVANVPPVVLGNWVIRARTYSAIRERARLEACRAAALASCEDDEP